MLGVEPKSVSSIDTPRNVVLRGGDLLHSTVDLSPFVSKDFTRRTSGSVSSEDLSPVVDTNNSVETGVKLHKRTIDLDPLLRVLSSDVVDVTVEVVSPNVTLVTHRNVSHVSSLHVLP